MSGQHTVAEVQWLTHADQRLGLLPALGGGVAAWQLARPGGGWLDHAIYYIDMLRWLFDSEVVRVSGEISNLKHPTEALEDFGVGNLVFDGSIRTQLEDLRRTLKQ